MENFPLTVTLNWTKIPCNPLCYGILNFLQENALNSIPGVLSFNLFWGSMPQTSTDTCVLGIWITTSCLHETSPYSFKSNVDPDL